MSEFVVIIEFVGTIVTFVFERTLDLICITALLASAFLPWRIPEIVVTVQECSKLQTSLKEWRALCLVSLCLTIFDGLAVPLGLFSLCSPVRWRQMYISFSSSSYKLTDSDDHFELRFKFIRSFGGALCDLFGYFVGLFAFCSLFGRQRVAWRLVSYNWNKETTFQGDSFETYNDRMDSICSVLCKQGFRSIFELLILIPVILTLWIPFTWATLLAGVQKLWREMPAVALDSQSPYVDESRFESEWEEWFNKLTCHLWMHCAHSVLDLAAAPFFLLAFISPLRHSLLLSDIRALKSERQTFNEAHPTSHTNTVGSFEFGYVEDVRWQALHYGFLAIADLFLLPMLLPLYLTRYRYVAIKKDLEPPPVVVTDGGEVIDSNNGSDSHVAGGAGKVVTVSSRGTVWGLKEIGTVAHQFALQFVDIFILLPSLPLLFVTQLRWKPVRELLEREESVFATDSFLLYRVAVSQLSLLVMDGLFLPFTLFVLLTHYRSDPLRVMWIDSRVWHAQQGMFHFAALANTLVVLFDLCVVCPALLIVCVLGPHRVPIIWDILRSHWRDCHEKQSALAAANTDRIVEGDGKRSAGNESGGSNGNDGNAPLVNDLRQYDLEDGAEEPYVLVADNGHNSSLSQQSAKVAAVPVSAPLLTARDLRVFPSGTVRQDILLHFFMTFVDLLVLVPSVVVVLTGWRATELWAEIMSLWRKEKLKTKQNRFANQTRSAYVQFMSQDNDEKIRDIVLTQFAFLLRDLLFLMPVAAVVGTVYRLPQLVSGLLSKLSGRALGDEETLFTITSCTVLAPDVGSPTLTYTLVLNPQHPLYKNFAKRDGSKEAYNLDAEADVELFLLGDSLFNNVASVFGGIVVNVVKAALPQKLREKDQTIGWKSFLQQLADMTEEALDGTDCADNTVISSSDDQVTCAVARGAELWVRSDIGKRTKKSSVIKNLRKLSPHTVMELQMEGYVTVTAEDGVLTRRKVILLRMSPAISHMLDVLESVDGVNTLPADSLNYSPSKASGIDNSEDRSGNLVNSFYLVVGAVFFDILLDLFYLLLFACTALSPYRFCKLVLMLLEPAYKLPVRVCEGALHSVSHIDRHLQELMRELSPVLNDVVKKQLNYDLTLHAAAADRIGNTALQTATHQSLLLRRRYGYYSYHLMNSYDCEGEEMAFSDRFRRQLEDFHLKPYRKHAKEVLKTVGSFDQCETALNLLQQRMKLHDKVMQLYFLRVACSAQLLGCYAASEGGATTEAAAESNANKHSVAMAVLAESYQSTVLALVDNRKQLSNELERLKRAHTAIEEPAKLKKPSFFKRIAQCCGLFSRPMAANRVLIKQAFDEARKDVGFTLLFLLLLCTLIRAVPLLRDLCLQSSCSVSEYKTRQLLIRHVVNLYHDVVEISRLLCYLTFLIVTVMALPSYLVDAPNHISSYRSATACAKKHCKWILWYFCEVLGLVFAFKTYKVVLKAGLYVFLVPGACLAQVVSFFSASTTTNLKFLCGFVSWIALLAGSIRIGVLAHSAGQGKGGFDDGDANDGILILCGCLFAVLLVAGVALLRHQAFLSVDGAASRSPDISWSHILAALCGPFESLQLSAVIMYFYWSAASGPTDQTHRDYSAELGSDYFSSRLLQWGDEYEGASHGYSVSVSIAVVLMLLWAVLVSIPLALSNASSTPQRNWEKALKFKSSALYELVVNVISRLFTVWIIATLLRSASCFSVSAAGQDDADYVLSTAPSVTCGGESSNGRLWSSRLTIPLLTFFIITSAVLHSDDAAYLKQVQTTAKSLDTEAVLQANVRFSPFYVLCVRAVQVFVCAACLGGFQVASAIGPLIAIALLCCVSSALPLLLRNHDLCSFALVTPLRSAGFLCVAWTAVVCIIRSYAFRSGRYGVFQDESAIFIGWGIIYGASLFLVAHIEYGERKAWEERLRASGLDAAIDLLLATIQSAVIDNSVLQPVGGSGAKSRQQQSSSLDIGTVRRQVQSARSSAQLARILVSLERLILAEKLTTPFLQHRKEWLDQLQQLQNENDRMDVRSNDPQNRALAAQQPKSPFPPMTEYYLDNGEVVHFTEEDVEVMAAAEQVDTALVDTRNAATVGMSPSFQQLHRQINCLSHGLRPSMLITKFSRPVFTILLTQKLPRDVCWVIYSYILNSRDISKVMFEASDLPARPSSASQHGSLQYANRLYEGAFPSLVTKTAKHESYIYSALEHSMAYVGNRRELIFEANTKQLEGWEKDVDER